jgi:hypothetical protein
MKNNKEREKELRELSEAIVEALTRNEEVMGLLTDLKERKVIEASTLLGLALKVNDLLEISGVAFTQDELEENRRIQSKAIAESLTEAVIEAEEKEAALREEGEATIDGRKLSKSEVAFQEWAAEKFDEKEWLRSMGLIL